MPTNQITYYYGGIEMDKYIGKICPFCKTEITADDEVMVCPACATPHHKGCWDENKGCTTFGCSEQHYVAQGTNPTDVCKKCGAALGDGQDFCPKCGTPKNAPPANVCGKCGFELQDGQEFCPKCGQKVGLSVDSGVGSAIAQFNEKQSKKNKKKVIIPIAIVGVLAIGGIAAYTLLKGPAVEEIVLSKESVELKANATQSVSYTITPSDAADAEVIWKSSNESVAVVDDHGKIEAVGDGSCTITVSAGGKSDTLSVTVKSGPDFNQIFTDCELDSEWAYVGSDGSYLTIDTNPHDKDDYTDYAAYLSIYLINDALGLPDSLTEKMGKTSALDGRQSQSFDEVTVSWKYHPDNGLEITYEAN